MVVDRLKEMSYLLSPSLSKGPTHFLHRSLDRPRLVSFSPLRSVEGEA